MVLFDKVADVLRRISGSAGAAFPSARKALSLIANDSGTIRNFVAVGGVLFAVPLWYQNNSKQNAALQRVEALQLEMQRVHQQIAGATKRQEIWAKLNTMVSMDSRFDSSVELKRAKMLLTADATFLPSTPQDRVALLDYCEWTATLALAQHQSGESLFDAHILAEKYGANIERLLANPFIQDQLLRNPSRWRNLLDFAAQVLQVSTYGLPKTSFGEEANHFIKNYETYRADCLPHLGG
jgi:hypothetical protein